MRPGSHAAGDGSFGRSAGIQAGRATGLLVIAVLIGLVLLHRSPGGGGLVASGGATTTNSGDALATDTTVRPTTNTTARSGSTNNSTTTQPLRAKADIKVLVANGTSTAGLAGTVSTTLRGKGYNTLASTNANLKVASTSAYFQSGYEGDAAVLAGVLGLPPTAVQPMPATLPVASVTGVNILVVVGPDLSSGSKSTTSSTVK